MTIYRPTQNLSVGGDLSQKFQPGGRNSGVSLKAEIPAPQNFSFLKNSDQKFWPFTKGCTTA
jgi:hypothetical protein